MSLKSQQGEMVMRKLNSIENQMKRIIISVCIAVIIILFTMPLKLKAEDNIDYIKSRPLTEEEIEAQKGMEPELKDNFVEDFNFKPSDIQTFSLLPQKYDSRNKGIISTVKNQGDWGCCWAISAVDAAETTAVNEQIQNKADYSEGHLAYFFYNRENDPLNNTIGDRNVLPQGSHYLNNGGNTMLAAQALATWSGFSDESVMPYQPYSDLLIPPSDTAYKDTALLKNALFLSDSIDELKDAIYKYGAISLNYYHNNTYYNYDTAAYCNPIDTGSNHAVVLVGWDDSYAKENFLHNGNVRNDGAWIVKNSWSSDWGDDGYFYLSYENLSNSNGVVFEVQPPDKYDHNYQYDGTASASYIKVTNQGKIANIYQAKGNSESGLESLKAVGVTLFDSNIEYSIQIYRNLSDLLNPESGEKMLETPVTGKTLTAGVKTIDLEHELYISKDEIYSVVIELKNAHDNSVRAGVEGNADYGWVSFQAAIEKENSYIYLNNKWVDLFNSGLCARIKAFTSDVDLQLEDLILSESKVILEKGESITLTANILPEESNNVPIIWSTDNSKVGKVESGIITAAGTGQCLITAKAGNKIAVCKVIVRPEASESIEVKCLNQSTIYIEWKKVEGAEGYKIYRQGPDENRMLFYKNIDSGSQTSFTDTNLENGEFYFYRIYSYFTDSEEKQILSNSKVYKYAKTVLPAVGNLKAKCSGKNKVSLSWNITPKAEGYLIYRQIGKNKFVYRGISSTNNYSDTTASDEDYNFYRVYPYFTKKGEKIPGITNRYVYAKGITTAVKNLRISRVKQGIKLTWNSSPTAEGYLIYAHKKGKYGYCGMTTSGTTFVDIKMLKDYYNFYWIFPYHKNKSGKMIIGETGGYAYCK